MLYIFRWREAEVNATTVLRLAPDNMEALFRRGLARTEMQQWNQARQGKKTTNFFETNLMNFLDIQAFLDGGGCSVKGRAVLDAITHYEEFSIPEPISDKSAFHALAERIAVELRPKKVFSDALRVT